MGACLTLPCYYIDNSDMLSTSLISLTLTGTCAGALAMSIVFLKVR